MNTHKIDIFKGNTMAIHYKSQHEEYLINPSNILYVQLFPNEKSISIIFSDDRKITLNFDESVDYTHMVRQISNQT